MTKDTTQDGNLKKHGNKISSTQSIPPINIPPVRVSNVVPPVMSHTSNRVKRPQVVFGINVKVVTGCGNMYIQLNWYKGKLNELFAFLGKSGGCAICQSEALTRSISLGLRSGVSIDDYIEQNLSIRCPNPVFFPKDKEVLSCPDAIAKTLRKYGNMTTEQVIQFIVELSSENDNYAVDSGVSGNIQTTDSAEEEYAMKEIKRLMSERENCEID